MISRDRRRSRLLQIIYRFSMWKELRLYRLFYRSQCVWRHGLHSVHLCSMLGNFLHQLILTFRGRFETARHPNVLAFERRHIIINSQLNRRLFHIYQNASKCLFMDDHHLNLVGFDYRYSFLQSGLHSYLDLSNLCNLVISYPHVVQ